MLTSEENILEILIEERMYNALEKTLNGDERYQQTEKELQRAIEEMAKADLSKEQDDVVDKALTAANSCGAAYGAVAYRQGFFDGIKLMFELEKLSRYNLTAETGD